MLFEPNSHDLNTKPEQFIEITEGKNFVQH